MSMFINFFFVVSSRLHYQAEFLYIESGLLVRVGGRQFNHKNALNIQTIFQQKRQNSAEICLKNVFYALPFILSGRFGNPYGRLGPGDG